MTLSPGTTVRNVDNPGRIGTVTNAPARERPSGTFVQVRWADNVVDYCHVDELEAVGAQEKLDPYGLVRKGRYGRAADLRRSLTFVHLAGRLANLVYAMGITETDFYPHQYRPLLALLDSPVNGILIADEVGLGKTIEAGLIWTELRARFDYRRLLVVCPAMLREKWRDELRRRFGVDARIFDAAGLLDALKQPHDAHGEGQAWIVSYQAIRPPKAWRPDAPSRPSRNSRWALADLLEEHRDDAGLFDMVVFDEAHYMRNRDSAQWRLGELLRNVSTYQIMLSATPINLRNRDLYNLLNLLDEDHFPSEHAFERLLSANQPLVAARDAVLNASCDAQQIMKHLKVAEFDKLLAQSAQLQALLRSPPTDMQLAQKSYRAELAESLERLNLLSYVVTRTRKRDVQSQRVQRDVHREPVEMSEAERALYVAVTEATRKFAHDRGISDGFLLSMPQRQVSSSPAAVAAAWFGTPGERDELVEDLELEYDDLLLDEEPPMKLRDALRAAIPSQVDLGALQRDDTKFKRLRDVIARFLKEHPGEKIVLFTTFRATARYLVKRLDEIGLPAAQLLGGQAETKQETIDRFRQSRTLRILVSTEVASEGVDLQFCRVLVNYDLPWNPTRIEQRIGRIDRLGQQASLIHIWNLYFANTIDERIVNRLFTRLRIFEEALGEAEAVVGDTVRRLESALFERPLTPEEESARVEEAAQALENLRLQRESLERNAAHMMAHGQLVMERIAAAQELARRVTEDDLYVYVKDYLELYGPGHSFRQDGDDRMKVSIQLPPDTAVRLEEFARENGMQGRTALTSGQPRVCHFLNRISARNQRSHEVIHQFHPLVKFITDDLRRRDEHFYPLVSVHVPRSHIDADLRPGEYAFYVRRWSFSGVRDEEVLAVAATRLDDGQPLIDDQADLLLQAARVHGRDWLVAPVVAEVDRVLDCFDEADASLSERYRSTLERRRNENADRARFQYQTVEEHLARRMAVLQTTLAAHNAAGRASLAAAIRGQMEKLKAKMEMRRQQIQKHETITADKQFICAGLIKLE